MRIRSCPTGLAAIAGVRRGAGAIFLVSVTQLRRQGRRSRSACRVRRVAVVAAALVLLVAGDHLRRRDDARRRTPRSASAASSGCATTAPRRSSRQVENWYYALNAPSKGGPALKTLPKVGDAVADARRRHGTTPRTATGAPRPRRHGRPPHRRRAHPTAATRVRARPRASCRCCTRRSPARASGTPRARASAPRRR